MSPKITRREFLTGAIATAYSPKLLANSERKLASLTDRVVLGKTGIRVSYLGFGTGTKGWDKRSNQTKLGTVRFSRLINYAYDLGVNYFDVADIYGTHSYVRAALKRIPRENYVIQTKIWYRTCKDAQQDLNRFLLELGTDYIDILLVHCVTEGTWAADQREIMDVLSAAKEKKIIRAHGISIHSLEAMKSAIENSWVDLALVRVNHKGAKMDGQPSEVVPVIKKLHNTGKAVVGIKILGEGTIAEERDASLKYVLGLDCIDSIIVGFESTEQIDDILKRGKSIMP
ncbi:MAG: aldo/keto reductase [Armatimonadetes bacterium]|nr:aldo/keto reductase [Armatimonadota bacterium]